MFVPAHFLRMSRKIWRSIHRVPSYPKCLACEDPFAQNLQKRGQQEPSLERHFPRGHASSLSTAGSKKRRERKYVKNNTKQEKTNRCD